MFTTTGGGSIVLPTGSPAAPVTVNEAQGNDNDMFALPITGSGSLQFTGSGSVFLYGNNTYSGGTYINRGSGINFNNNNSFGTGPIVHQFAGEIVLAVPATAQDGYAAPTGAITIANPVITANQEILLVHATAANVINFTGPWTMPASGQTCYFRDNNAGTVNWTGLISGAGIFEIGGAGTVSLAANNTWTGGYLHHNGQVVNYNGNNAFGTGTINISSGSGAFVNNTVTSVTLPNAFNWSGAYSLNLVGGLPVGGQPGTIFTGNVALGANQATIYTGGNVGNVDEFTGVISGTGGINTDDNGILELAGANTFTGPITVGVALGGKSPILAIVGAGKLGSSGTYANSINNATGSTFLYSSSAAQTLSGVVSGGGMVKVSGPGSLKLSAANTYTGGTTITGGTLEVSGSIAGNVTNTAGVLKLDNTTALATTAIVSLAASPAAGAVNLNYTGSQTVKALYFGGVQQAIGTWGGTGSGAANINPAFAANTGVLNVTTGPAVAPPYSVASESVDGSGNMTMTWSSAAGYTYHIIHGTAATPKSTWATVAGSSITATGSTTSFTFPTSGYGSFQLFTVVSP